MNLFVNATPLLGPVTGIGQYIQQLFSVLQDLPHLNTQFHYGYKTRKRLPQPMGNSLPQGTQTAYALAKKCLPRLRTLKLHLMQQILAHTTRRLPADCIYHEPNFLPFPYEGPLAITVHDISCFRHPETHPQERVALMEKYLPAALLRANSIITVSRFTAEEVIRYFGIPENKVVVTHLGVTPDFRPLTANETQSVLQAQGLTYRQYILCVGTLEPRKNLSRLFAAYAALPEQLRARYPLVVAGISGWHTHALLNEAERLRARGEIRLLGYVPAQQLPALYAGARCFAYPSFYEGFGLPPLEAMACATPVLTANCSSLPEVVGEAGLQVDPLDTEAIRAGLHRLLEDEAYTHALARQGLDRAARFSWQQCAEQTLLAYQQALRHHGG